jgi:putative transposase
VACTVDGMGRRKRRAVGGEVYHALNRAAGQFRMLRTEKDFAAMERVLAEALERVPTRLLSYCLMGTHWHLVLWPREDGELSAFLNWLTLTHTQRWRHAHRTVGHGPLYQGRFKSFPVQSDEHVRKVCRYVERNALRAKLVAKAQDWRWSSLWHRLHPGEPVGKLLTDDWPVSRPGNWVDLVNEPQSVKELAALRTSVERGRPYGEERWQLRTARRLELESSLRPPGRPKKQENP